MIKKIKPAILFLIPVLFLQGISGQGSVNMTEYLTKKFQSFTTAIPREEIYVHTDRDEYISGEALWFNIYVLDRKSLKPSSESRIAYFELLNPENRPIVQKKIGLDGGSGQGQIVLPDTLSTGTYIIRAYTNWMKNFLPFNCFSREVHIYNAFSSRAFKRNMNSAASFTPDGGIMNYSQSYANSGLALNVDNLKTDILEIDVLTTEKYRAENSNQFYLSIQTRGNINRISAQGIKDENTRIFIPKKALPPGINQITVFNSKGKPVGERFIYTPDQENHVLTIHSADSVGTRSKISLDLEVGNGLPNMLNSSSLSISVEPLTNSHFFADINDYMIFGSEFGLSASSPLITNEIRKMSPEVIDSLLQNVRSTWIDWNAILADEMPVLRYEAEKDDHFLSGKLLSGDKKSDNADKYVILSRPGKIASFQYAKTDKEGSFSFRVNIDEKVTDYIVQPDVALKSQSLNIESPFSDKFYKSTVTVDSAGKLIPDYISAWSVNLQVRKIYGISSTGKLINRPLTIPVTKRFYGKPDQELIMKDYIALPVMQEVFFELLAGVFMKNKKSVYEITINDPDNNKPYDVPPGLFVDGVMVKDPALIAGIEPEQVEKIEVVREKYIIGDYLFYGLVNVLTKAGDFSNVTLPDYAIRLPYRAIDPVFSFVSPDYTDAAIKRSRIPDFRNTLYWNPSVKTDKDGKARVEFWSSDNKSEYVINIQGITQEGKLFGLTKIIKIKR
jgi:hypothetical protein